MPPIRRPISSSVAAATSVTSPEHLPPQRISMRSLRLISSSRSAETSRMAAPFFFSSSRVLRTKLIAPISSPRVGWAAIRSFGPRLISRASTIFCRLPPDMPRMESSSDTPRISKFSLSSSLYCSILLLCSTPRRENRAVPSRPQIRFSPSLALRQRPVFMRSSEI